MITWEDLEKLPQAEPAPRGRLSGRCVFKRHRCDGSNVGFPGRNAAKHAARSIQRIGGPWLRPFFCRDCGEWHLGHRTRPTPWHRRRYGRRRNR